MKKLLQTNLIFSLILLVFIPSFVLAQKEYVPLTGSGIEVIDPFIPGGKEATGGGINLLVNQAFTFFLVAAIVLSIVMIIYGGFRYVTSLDSGSAKDAAKKRIRGAVWGLLIVFSAYLILNTINPRILNFNTEFPEVAEPDEIDLVIDTFVGGTLSDFGNLIPSATYGTNSGNVGLNNSGVISNIGTPLYAGNVSHINWTNNRQKISKYFTVGDVTKNGAVSNRSNCKGNNRIPTDPVIIRNIMQTAVALDQVREEWGSGLIVHSWYRPRNVNKCIPGAAPNSKHIQGIAVDIKPVNGQIKELQRWLLNNWSGGVGTYSTFVHIDRRNNGCLNCGSASATW
jgi:hypothetical protein